MNDQKSDPDLLLNLLEGLSVPDLDARLTRLSREWRRYYSIRMMLAAEQGVKTPAPLPPSIDGQVAQAPQEKSSLTWRGLIETYKTHERSPYQTIKFATRNFYDSLLKRLVEDFGDGRLVDTDADDVTEMYEAWKGTGKLSMTKALTGMARSLINFGATILDDPECHRLAVPFHRMRQLSDRRTIQTIGLTEDYAKAVIEQAHKMGLHSIALAQAVQFGCSLGQKDVIGEWVPNSEPGESDIVDGGDKWIRGLHWSNIDRNLILRHNAGRSQDAFEYDLRDAPMVLDELDRYRPRPTSGPLIIYEQSGLPYRAQQFRRMWREVADAARVPKNVKNKESRKAKDERDAESGAQ